MAFPFLWYTDTILNGIISLLNEKEGDGMKRKIEEKYLKENLPFDICIRHRIIRDKMDGIIVMTAGLSVIALTMLGCMVKILLDIYL